MPRPNKIRLEHLDKTLIEWLKTGILGGAIKYEDLSTEVKNMISSQGGNSNYNDEPLKREIAILQEVKADKTKFSEYFNKNTDKIGTADVDEELKVLLDFIKELRRKIPDRIRTHGESIGERDLDGALMNKINGYEEKIANLRALVGAVEAIVSNAQGGTVVGGADTPEIFKKLKQIMDRQEEIGRQFYELRAQKEYIEREMQKFENLKQELNNKASLDNNQKLLRSQLPSDVLKQSDTPALKQEILEAVNGAGNNIVIKGQSGMVASISVASDKFAKGILYGTNMLQFCHIVDTPERLEELKKQNAFMIIDSKENKVYISIPKIIDAESGEFKPGYEYLEEGWLPYPDGNRDWEPAGVDMNTENKSNVIRKQLLANFKYVCGENIERNHFINQKLFYDLETNAILFCDYGTFINIASGTVYYKIANSISPLSGNAIDKTPVAKQSEPAAAKKRIARKTEYYDIAANGSKKILIPNAQVSGAIVLVKDPTNNSPTKGKYINSEAIVTVAHYSEAIEIYNSINEQVSVCVIYNANDGTVLKDPTISEHTVGASGSLTIPVKNAKIAIQHVLVKDTRPGKTQDKYINSEAIATVSYPDDNNITVYNTQTYPIDIMVSYYVEDTESK